MDERYTRLFSLSENLYAAGSPVMIAAGVLLKDNKTGRIVAQLKFKNIGSKAIKALKVLISPFDIAGRPFGQAQSFDLLDFDAPRDSYFGQKTAMPMQNTSTRAFSVAVEEVIFTDNSIWTYSGDPWEPVPEQLELEDSELKKQLQLKYGPRSEFLPVVYKDLWLCVCGAVNREEESCHCCGNDCETVLSYDLEQLEQEKIIRIAKEAAERERLMNLKKSMALKLKNRKILIITISAILVIALILLTSLVLIPEAKYREAVRLINEGQYDEAITKLYGLNGYKDSLDLIVKATEMKMKE